MRDEKLRGFLASLVTGFVAGSAHITGTSLGLDATLSALLFMYILGSFMSYVMDIMFAKSTFYMADIQKTVPLLYTEFRERFSWLLRSFAGRYFGRFVLTVVIDALVGIALLRAAIRLLDHYEILTDFAWRDLALSGIIAGVTFLLYTNVLRFDWAYQNDTDFTTDMVVLMSLVIILVIYAQTYQTKDIETSAFEEAIRKRLI